LKKLKKKDILITSAAHSGENIGKKCSIISELPPTYESIFFTGELLNIRCLYNESMAKWLFYFFSSKYGVKEIQKAVSGVHLTSGRAKLMEVVIPPDKERARIVAKLEKLLTRVDQCQARLEKIPGILENFRTTIISAACTGKLTKDWRQKNKDAKSASSGPHHPTPNKKSQKKPSYFQRNWFEELPASWSWAYLSEISDCRLGKMLDKSKNKGEKTRYLRNINVRWFTVDLTDLLEIRASAEDKRKLSLKKGDVLVCEGGEPGRAAVWNREDSDIIYQKALHRVRSDGSFLPSWLVYNLKNDSKNWRLSSLFTGTTIKHLTGQSLAKYPLAIPPIEEQKEIIRRIEKLFQLADHIEHRYHKAKTHIDHLTQSILAKAFRGELVPQNPNDEPAAELLRQIKNEKDRQSPENKSGRNSKNQNQKKKARA